MTNKDIYEDIKIDIKYLLLGILGISEYQSFYVTTLCAILTRLFIYSIIGYCIYDAYTFSFMITDENAGLINLSGLALVIIGLLLVFAYILSIIYVLIKVNIKPLFKFMCKGIMIKKRK